MPISSPCESWREPPQQLLLHDPLQIASFGKIVHTGLLLTQEQSLRKRASLIGHYCYSNALPLSHFSNLSFPVRCVVAALGYHIYPAGAGRADRRHKHYGAAHRCSQKPLVGG